MYTRIGLFQLVQQVGASSLGVQLRRGKLAFAHFPLTIKHALQSYTIVVHIRLAELGSKPQACAY